MIKYRSHYLFSQLAKNVFRANTSGLSWDFHEDTKPSANGLMVLAKSEYSDTLIMECGNVVAVRFDVNRCPPLAWGRPLCTLHYPSLPCTIPPYLALIMAAYRSSPRHTLAHHAQNDRSLVV